MQPAPSLILARLASLALKTKFAYCPSHQILKACQLVTQPPSKVGAMSKRASCLSQWPKILRCKSRTMYQTNRPIHLETKMLSRIGRSNKQQVRSSPHARHILREPASDQF